MGTLCFWDRPPKRQLNAKCEAPRGLPSSQHAREPEGPGKPSEMWGGFAALIFESFFGPPGPARPQNRTPQIRPETTSRYPAPLAAAEGPEERADTYRKLNGNLSNLSETELGSLSSTPRPRTAEGSQRTKERKSWKFGFEAASSVQESHQSGWEAKPPHLFG